jgi:hypothetical protein
MGIESPINPSLNRNQRAAQLGTIKKLAEVKSFPKFLHSILQQTVTESE